MAGSPFSFYNLCDYFEYLDTLRDGAEVNMSGAATYLSEEYPDLEKQEAREVCQRWRNTFSAEPLEERVSKAQTALP